MKTGRVILSATNTKGQKLEKKFNFVLSTNVEYPIINSIVRNVRKSSYDIEVIGGIKDPNKSPVLSLEELLIKLSTFRFTETVRVPNTITEEELIGTFGFHAPYICSATVQKGDYYYFFKLGLDPDYELVGIDYEQICANLDKMGLGMNLAESGFFYIADHLVRPEIEINVKGYYNVVMNIYKKVEHTTYETKTITL